MKKIFTLLLAFTYVAFSAGVVVSAHFCMGQLTELNINKASQDICGKCGMKEKKGCCEESVKLVKLQDDHQTSQAGFILYSPHHFLLDAPVRRVSVKEEKKCPEECSDPSPPKPPFSVLYSIFRI